MKKENNPFLLPLAIAIAGIMIAFGIIYRPADSVKVALEKKIATQAYESSASADGEVYPKEGIELPIAWKDLGKLLVESGAIDGPRFEKLYSDKGGYTDEYDKLLNGNSPENLKITRENAGFPLNLFWALGLSNQNEILTAGEMSNPKYGGAGRFASTGGWTMSLGDVMNHYSRHSFITLTTEQQQLVDKISRGIYRPCCDNSTHFPDCNHGMAMLGLLELMASQGVNEEEMWNAALVVNSYWFPDVYMTLAAYMKIQGVAWRDVNPQEILGYAFSSSSGYSKIASQIRIPSGSGSSGGCGVDTDTLVPRQETSCGI